MSNLEAQQQQLRQLTQRVVFDQLDAGPQKFVLDAVLEIQGIVKTMQTLLAVALATCQSITK